MAVNADNLTIGAVPNESARDAKPAAAAVIDKPDSTKFKKLTAMTDWYNPWQLIETAKKTVISTIIGENADPRLLGKLPDEGKFFDYSIEFASDNFEAHAEQAAPRREIWIDYVSDVGDGFNSTYSVAYSLAKEELDVSGDKLPRGEILIFGGDGVYPTATSAEYEKKLVKPYRLAVNAQRRSNKLDAKEADLKKLPHIFVLPGNHDWYDSLVAFQKIFCTSVFNKRYFAGGWRTRQNRSYFALKLPQNWWLLGIDLQLSHNIDVPQLQYFESVVAKMNEGDKVILCVPEPYWVKAIKYEEFEDAFEKFVEKEESIRALEEILKKNKVQRKLYVAGDLHHYRRFESNDAERIQKITAGGGGAFLHPTHDFEYKGENRHRKSKSARTFKLEMNYPDAKLSHSLDKQNFFGFMFNSPYFGVLTGILYAALALLIRGVIPGDYFSWREAFRATAIRFLTEPLAFLVVVATLLGLVFFTDSHSKTYRRVAGLIHGLTHLTAIFFLGWLGYRLSLIVNDVLGLENSLVRSRLVWAVCIVVVCGVGGYFIGSFIMGVYLFISLHFFKRHDNEAFSALKIEDYKNFLRMKIDDKGDLTIYPIKIEKVARDWKYVPGEDRNSNGDDGAKPDKYIYGGGFYEPKPENPVVTELIEPKIEVPGNSKIEGGK